MIHPRLHQEPVFDIQSIESLFGILVQDLMFLFDRYLFLNNFSEVFLHKEKLMRVKRRPSVISSNFVPVLTEAISLEHIYIPGLFEADFLIVFVTDHGPERLFFMTERKRHLGCWNVFTEFEDEECFSRVCAWSNKYDVSLHLRHLKG